MKNRFPTLFVVLLALLVADCGFCVVMLYQYNNTCGLAGLAVGTVLLAAIILMAFNFSRNTFNK